MIWRQRGCSGCGLCEGMPHPKAGRWYKKIGARVNLDQNDPENNDGEVRFWIGVAKSCARAFK